MQRRGKKKAVREPVQVYLDEQDSRLLEDLTERLALSKAEALRIGLRRLSVQVVAEDQPGHALSALVGALDEAPDVPRDLAEKHDEYLYGKPNGDARRR